MNHSRGIPARVLLMTLGKFARQTTPVGLKFLFLLITKKLYFVCSGWPSGVPKRLRHRTQINSLFAKNHVAFYRISAYTNALNVIAHALPPASPELTAQDPGWRGRAGGKNRERALAPYFPPFRGCQSWWVECPSWEGRAKRAGEDASARADALPPSSGAIARCFLAWVRAI